MQKKALVMFFILGIFLPSCAHYNSSPSGRLDYAQRDFEEAEETFYEESPVLAERQDNFVAKRKVASPKAAQGGSLATLDSSTPPLTQKMIYSSYLELETRDLKETQTKVLDLMKSLEGFLESQTSQRIAFRVPAQNFNQAIESLMLLGKVIEKKIFTQDVSEQFSDIQRRLFIAEKSKARLVAMLEKAKEIKEKVRIIEEIKRLSQEIESYKNSLATLDSFVNYSFIEVVFKVPNLQALGKEVSPFVWINTLTPFKITLDKVPYKKVNLSLPEKYLVFQEEETYIARNPEGAFIRVGKTDNEPLGDGEFWQKALSRGIELKNYEIVSSSQKGSLYYSVFRFRGHHPESFLVALKVQEKEIFILEAFFPSEKIRNEQESFVIHSLSSFEVQP